jgi:hypothetical protein
MRAPRPRVGCTRIDASNAHNHPPCMSGLMPAARCDRRQARARLARRPLPARGPVTARRRRAQHALLAMAPPHALTGASFESGAPPGLAETHAATLRRRKAVSARRQCGAEARNACGRSHAARLSAVRATALRRPGGASELALARLLPLDNLRPWRRRARTARRLSTRAAAPVHPSPPIAIPHTAPGRPARAIGRRGPGSASGLRTGAAARAGGAHLVPGLLGALVVDGGHTSGRRLLLRAPLRRRGSTHAPRGSPGRNGRRRGRVERVLSPAHVWRACGSSVWVGAPDAAEVQLRG